MIPSVWPSLASIFLIDVGVEVRAHATLHGVSPGHVALGCRKADWASDGTNPVSSKERHAPLVSASVPAS